MPDGIDHSLGPGYTSTCLPAGRIGDGEVVKGGLCRELSRAVRRTTRGDDWAALGGWALRWQGTRLGLRGVS
jgi:hypothetical protein